MVTLVKPARKHTLDVLAAEEKDVKVETMKLYNHRPGNALRPGTGRERLAGHHLRTIHCEHVRKMSTEWFNRTLTKEKVAETLGASMKGIDDVAGKLLWENTFESGETWNAMGERAANLIELTKATHH